MEDDVRMTGLELDGYPQEASSIGARLASKRWRGHLATHWTRVGEITLLGRPLRDEPYRTRTPHPNDNRPSKKFGELLAVARVLALTHRSGDLRPSERPDVLASTSLDGLVGVEVAEITESAPHSAVLDEIRSDLRSRIEAMSISPRARTWLWFDEKVAERNGVGAHYSASDPGRFLPRGQDRKKILDEIVDLVAAGVCGHCEIVCVSSYPMLARYGARLATVPDGAFVQIDEGTIAYSPKSLVPTAHALLERKRLEARAYGFAGAKWLVLNITDRRGEFYETAKEFAESAPEIEPFDQVHVLYEQILMTVDGRFGVWSQTVIKQGTASGRARRRR